MGTSNPAPGGALQEDGEAGHSLGFLAGMRELAWVVPVRWAAAPPPLAALTALEPAIREAVPGASAFLDPGPAPEASPLEWLAHWTQQVLRGAGLPTFEPARVLPPAPGHAGPWWVLLPATPLTWQATAEAFAAMVALLEGPQQAARLAELPALATRLRRLAPLGSNTVPLLQAAHEAGIPTTHVAGGVFQFGQGARARLLKSTFTDQTPAFGVEWARDKVLAAQVLRRAGLPTPEHRLVTGPADALEAAGALGYPVVVKPADRDGGVGVAAGLSTPEAVSAAYEEALSHSDRVLVERHAEGRDYRLTVFQGEVVWAIERVPGGVTGDGVRPVADLVAEVNRDPRRGDGPHRPMTWLTLDAEALALLAEAGLTADSVPPAGAFVRLRRAANIARGGTPVAVMARVHPDNRRLAVRAAAALRLDLAGVDLLIPDIARSWLETGAAICEVNAQPELGTATNERLHGEVLRGLVRGTGRIPVVVAVGAEVGAGLVPAIAAALTAAGHTVGRLDGQGAYLGEALVARAPHGTSSWHLDGADLLLAAPEATAVVLAVEDAAALETGLPVARCDVLVVAGTVGPAADASAATGTALVGAWLQACDGTAIPVAGSDLPLHVAPGQPRACWVTAPVPAREVPAWVCDAVREAVAHHEAPTGAGGLDTTAPLP